MYSISFYSSPSGGMRVLVGQLQAVLAVAELCEYKKQPFKIANVEGYLHTQLQLGCGGYEYWLDPDQKF
jgi:hypothetical protein